MAYFSKTKSVEKFLSSGLHVCIIIQQTKFLRSSSMKFKHITIYNNLILAQEFMLLCLFRLFYYFLTLQIQLFFVLSVKMHKLVFPSKSAGFFELILSPLLFRTPFKPLIRLCFHSQNRVYTHSLTHSFTQFLTHSFTHFFTHFFTRKQPIFIHFSNFLIFFSAFSQ